MDYLVCEENTAETLQFFAWFSDYATRWLSLSPQEMLLSPPWTKTSKDSKAGRSGSAPIVQNHVRGESERLAQILQILDNNKVDVVNNVAHEGRKKDISDPMNFSLPRTSSCVQFSQVHVARSPWSLNSDEASTRRPTQEEVKARRKYFEPKTGLKLEAGRSQVSRSSTTVPRRDQPNHPPLHPP